MTRTVGAGRTKSSSRQRHRLDRERAHTLAGYKRGPLEGSGKKPQNVVVDSGWGRLVFGHTFESNERLVETLEAEQPGRRDIAMYLADPHVVLAMAPQTLFLDPSHTYRLYLEQFRVPTPRSHAFAVRKLLTQADAEGVNEVYNRRRMVAIDPEFIWDNRTSRVLTYFLAEDCQTGEIIGTVTGVDHVQAFDDPENGASLWALAVDPRTTHPGVGQALVAHLVEHYIARGRSFLDLSVMHDNAQAIRLYEKLGFSRVPVFCVKRKNPINEALFIAGPPEAQLNPYAAIIVREARRRGIAVTVLDEEQQYFELSFGGRSIVCRESLSELTTAVAMSRCDDKRVTRRVLTRAGLTCPDQCAAGSDEENAAFLGTHGRIVVKPARGEQGRGVSVGIESEPELHRALEAAGPDAILEEMVDGEDLRIIVIDYRVEAAAVRRPPQVTGTGEHPIRELIEKQSRRRSAATGGESHIPMDAEAERCLRAQGYRLDDVLESGKTITVRRAANLHAGGTIHDVTARLHPDLVRAAERAAEALDIPVVGLDFMVKAIEAPDYWIIEANERPGLANHEPQPTAERFIDLLFPQTMTPSNSVNSANGASARA